MRFLVVVGVTLILGISGCDLSPAQSKRFLLTESERGEVYRLDTQTGEITLVTPDGLVRLNYKTPQLEIGRYYRLEDPPVGDPHFLKYLGNGSFEESEYAVLNNDSK